MTSRVEEERKASTEGSLDHFKCRFCSNETYSPAEFERSLPLATNEFVKALIKQPGKQNFSVICEKHPESQVSRYCITHRQMICSECAIEEHYDHMKDTKALSREGIIKFFQDSLGSLANLNERIIQSME